MPMMHNTNPSAKHYDITDYNRRCLSLLSHRCFAQPKNELNQNIILPRGLDRLTKESIID